MQRTRIGSHVTANLQRHVRLAALIVVVAGWMALSQSGVAHARMTPRLRLVLHATTDDRTTVQVLVYTRVPLGAYTLQMSFDPRAVAVVDLQGGSTPEFAAVPMVDRGRFDSGELRFAAFQAARRGGPRGRVHVATLTFRRVQQPAAATELAVEAITLADTEGIKYTARPVHKAWRPRRPREAHP